MTPNERPIFVVGFQRSGTTLLQSLIGSHPRIASPPETYFLFRIARLADRYGDLADDTNLRRALHDALHPPVDLLSECGFDEEVVVERARQKQRTMRGLFEAIMEDFAERQGKVRWSEKSPGQTAAEIVRTFPDAQIVHIVRDPRDVIASSLRTPWTDAGAFQLAQNWRRFTRSNVRQGMMLGPRSFLQIAYEHLTREPSTIMAHVCEFLGESFDPTMTTDAARRRPTVVSGAAPWQSRALGAIEPARDGAWRTQLGRREQLIVEAVLGAELEALGYEPSTPRRRAAGWLLASPDLIRLRARARRVRRQARDAQWRERMTDEFLNTQAGLVETSRRATGTSER